MEREAQHRTYLNRYVAPNVCNNVFKHVLNFIALTLVLVRRWSNFVCQADGIWQMAKQALRWQLLLWSTQS